VSRGWVRARARTRWACVAGRIPLARIPLARIPLALIPLALFGLVGCGGGRVQSGVAVSDLETQGRSADQGALAPGVHTLRIHHDGRLRTARVFVPEASNREAARAQPEAATETVEGRFPVVLAFHGGGGQASGFAESNGLEAVAAREGFVVVHPEGTGPGGVNTWNAGAFCCGTARDQNVDDVGFVLALVRELALKVPVDSLRIYATGHSNGAMMAYRLAEETHGTLLAAIAPVAGARAPEGVSALEPIPILHFHSVDDPRALYEGGTGPSFPLTNHRVDHPSVSEMLAAWRQVNGCAETAERLALRTTPTGAQGTTPSRSLGGEQRAELLAWNTCTSGAPVRHWRFEGVGHGWPGHRLPLLRQGVSGPSTSLVLAAEEIWAFFQGWSRTNRRS